MWQIIEITHSVHRHPPGLSAKQLEGDTGPCVPAQVLQNLLSNAVKFCDDGGAVSMSVDVDDDTGCLRAVVADTGRGLNEEGLKRIFRPFSQAEGSETKAKYGGTGLGEFVTPAHARVLSAFLSLPPPPPRSLLVSCSGFDFSLPLSPSERPRRSGLPFLLLLRFDNLERYLPSDGAPCV